MMVGVDFWKWRGFSLWQRVFLRDPPLLDRDRTPCYTALHWLVETGRLPHGDPMPPSIVATHCSTYPIFTITITLYFLCIGCHQKLPFQGLELFWMYLLYEETRRSNILLFFRYVFLFLSSALKLNGKVRKSFCETAFIWEEVVSKFKFVYLTLHKRIKVFTRIQIFLDVLKQVYLYIRAFVFLLYKNARC